MHVNLEYQKTYRSLKLQRINLGTCNLVKRRGCSSNTFGRIYFPHFKVSVAALSRCGCIYTLKGIKMHPYLDKVATLILK
jgi:hypothetical protein